MFINHSLTLPLSYGPITVKFTRRVKLSKRAFIYRIRSKVKKKKKAGKWLISWWNNINLGISMKTVDVDTFE